jgi:hypothetical protein
MFVGTRFLYESNKVLFSMLDQYSRSRADSLNFLGDSDISTGMDSNQSELELPRELSKTIFISQRIMSLQSNQVKCVGSEKLEHGNLGVVALVRPDMITKK